MKTTISLFITLSILLTGLHGQEIRLHSIAADRQPGGDNGYTLDGIHMINNSRPKLQNPDYFGSEYGIYEKDIIIKDAYGSAGSLENITETDDIDILFFGNFNKADPSFITLSEAEIDSLYIWSKRGGKLIIGVAAPVPSIGLDPSILNEKWGFDLPIVDLNMIVPILPTLEGENSLLFDGPFGDISLVNQGGSVQGYFSIIPEDVVILAEDALGNPTLYLDCETLDLVLSDCDAYTDLGGISMGFEIQNENDEFWLNTIAYMDELDGPPVVIQSGSTLSTGNYLSYQWLIDGQPISGATESTYTIEQDGTYSVAVSMACGCDATSEEVFITFTGIEDLILQDNMNIFPNPASDQFTFEFTLLEQAKVELSLFNATGQNIILEENSMNLPSGHHLVPLNVSSLSPGSYSLKVTTERGTAGLTFLIR